MSAPLAVTPLWVLVIDRAGRRCQCTGQCGHRHTRHSPRGRVRPGAQPAPDPRCVTELGNPAARLYAAPTDPAVPVADAWQVPTSAMAAWCGPCLDGARAQARRTPEPDAPAPAGLFDLPNGACA